MLLCCLLVIHALVDTLLLFVLLAAVHLVLDLVLMFPCGLGIKGAAISTAVSEWLAAGAYVTLVWGKRDLLGLWPPPQLQPAQLKERCLPFLQVRVSPAMRGYELPGWRPAAAV
jgi:Na+-driven multidrug efflux pump